MPDTVLARNTAAFVAAYMRRNHEYFTSVYSEDEATQVVYEVTHAAVLAAVLEGEVFNPEAMEAKGADYLPVIGG